MLDLLLTQTQTYCQQQYYKLKKNLVHATFYSITNTNTLPIITLQGEGNVTHGNIFLAQTAKFPITTSHYGRNIARARVPFSTNISTINKNIKR